VQGGWRIAAPGAFALAGLLFATSAGVSRGQDLRGSRSDLPDLIQAEEARLREATDRIDRLQAEIDAATNQAAQQDGRVRAEHRRAVALSQVAGTTPVKGPGTSVTLADAPRSADRMLPPGTSPDDLVVHQQDVQAVVNALWQGGAEAMMLMDQRIISTSAVRCVGNTLILQGRVYSPPYVITAIGNQSDLRASLDASPTVGILRQWVDAVGLGYDVTTGQATFPAYAGSINLRDARAAR
jgi:uncharacterized protein YlxW (UPF0749 family)